MYTGQADFADRRRRVERRWEMLSEGEDRENKLEMSNAHILATRIQRQPRTQWVFN